jgi:Chemoreceptor zinc-binding domain
MRTVLFAALTAHVAWKEKLRQAIDSGIIDPPPAKISQDNLCAFGKWLYSPDLAPEVKASVHYQSVVKTHAAFHKAASEVAMLAEIGEKEKARQMMLIGQPFMSHANSIRREIMNWMQDLPD